MFIALSFSTAVLLSFTLNPKEPNDYSWKSRSVYPGNVDCVAYNNSFGIFCVSNFENMCGNSFAAMVPSYVSIISVNISPGPGGGLFMEYNYTGANWTLMIGSI